MATRPKIQPGEKTRGNQKKTPCCQLAVFLFAALNRKNEVPGQNQLNLFLQPSFEADLVCLASSNRRSAPFGSLRLTWQQLARGSRSQAQLRSIKLETSIRQVGRNHLQQCFATGKGHVADFAASLRAKDVPLSWPSAGLRPCGASLELETSNVEP